MSIFSKRKIKVAATKRNKFNLSSKVITTLNIGDTQPIYCREVIPSDKWSIDINSFTRLSPLPVPTYAQIKQVNRAFFVKYKDIWRNWEAFYTNTGALLNGSKIDVTEVPTITNAQLVSKLINSTVTVVNYRGDTPESLRLFESALEGKGVFKYNAIEYNPTFIGKKVLNILNGLGIRVNFSSSDTTPINILPILAYLKVHLDYYLPSRYFATSNIRNILSWQNKNIGEQFHQILQELANCAYYYLDNDYFTSSWSTPNNLGQNSLVGNTSIIDVSTSPTAVVRDTTQSYPPTFSQASAETTTSLSAQGLQLLQSLYNWITRKNLSGNKYFEQILSQFGIHLPYHDDMRSLYLGGSVNMTEFGVVFDTGLIVGDYAGQGTNKARTGKLNFTSDEYGCVIVLTSIVPEMGYVQGRNREWLHVNRLDFFQPEFDCIGMQGVRKDELLTVNNEDNYKDVVVSDTTYSNKAGTIIGYQPRYNEYRRNIDLLNGDFVNSQTNKSLDAYHSFRLLDENYPQASTLNQYFRRSDSFSPSINRIFNNTDIDFDHFIAVFDVHAIAMRKMKSHDDAFDLDGYDEVTVNNDNSLD